MFYCLLFLTETNLFSTMFWWAIASDDFRWPGVTWSYPPTDCEDWEWSYTEGTNLDAERYLFMHVSSLQLTHCDYQRNN